MAATRTPTRAERPSPDVTRPRRWRYVPAAALILGGLALALGFGLGGAQTRANQAEGFARVAVPGSMTLDVARSSTYHVYSEGTACMDFPNCHGQLYPVTVKVTGPGGVAINVESTSGSSYMMGGAEGAEVASFDATAPGRYRVAATTGPYSEGMIAVGKGFPTWTGDWLTWLAMLVLWAAALLVIALPIARYRRSTARVGPLPPPAR